MKTNYQIFRGNCKEACEALQSALPDLELIRGHYVPLFTGKAEPHWWLKTPKKVMMVGANMLYP